GRTWDEASGKDFLELGYEPWQANMHTREIEQAIKSKKPVRGEAPFHGTNGRRIYDYIFSPIIGLDGEVEAVSGITRDVTERKSAEDAAKNPTGHASHLTVNITSSDDAIISQDLQGFITSWNKGAEPNHGYTAQGVLGKHITLLIPPERLDEEDT